MSKNNVRTSRGALLLLAMIAATSASAITLEEFSAKNRELLTLKTDLEIVKKKQEIKKETEGKSDSASAKGSSVSSSMPGLPMMGQGGQGMSAQPVSSVEQEGLVLKSISGDITNPHVEFTFNGQDMPDVTKGQSIVSGWRLVSVEGRTVVVERASSGKQKSERKTLYLAGASSSVGMSRYDPVSASGAMQQRSALSPASSALSPPPMPSMPTVMPPTSSGAGMPTAPSFGMPAMGR